MNQQAADMPKFVQILGRYKALIGIMALLGLLAGALFAVLNPPVFTSQATVIFPASWSCPAGAICGGPAFEPNQAAPTGSRLPWSLPAGVQVKSFAANGLWVMATAGSAAQAQSEAAAAAQSYYAYAESMSYPGEQATAQIVQPATQPTETPAWVRLRDDLLLGALFGALLGVIVALGAGSATIDPPTVPRGYDIGGDANQAGQETRYVSPRVPRQQTALEYASSRAARDGAIDD